MRLKDKLFANYEWLSGYSRAYLGSDLISALILSVLLVPQSLAYALLAGLPPQMGIYAAIFPAIAYAFYRLVPVFVRWPCGDYFIDDFGCSWPNAGGNTGAQRRYVGANDGRVSYFIWLNEGRLVIDIL